MTTRIHRVLHCVAATIVAVATVAGCSTPETPPQPWRTDDLLQDQSGRFYTTCEDPANERHEREVWLTDEQAANHAEGQDCPTGEVRTPDYWQEPEADKKRTTAKPPPKPVSSGAKPTAATPTGGRGTTAVTPADKPRTPTTVKPTKTRPGP